MKVTTGSHYLAFVLDERCRINILGLYRKRHAIHVCHHVTIQFAIKEEKLPELQALVDSNPRFELDCLVESEHVDFFRVLVDGRIIDTDQSSTHLTFTRKAEAQNRYSSKVLRGELEHSGVLSAGGVLTGHFALIPY